MRRLAALLLPLVAATTLAAAAAGDAVPLAVGERFVLHSAVLGEDRAVLVAPPPGYAEGGDRYPVVVTTDGDAHLVHLRGTASFLARNGLMPEVIVVGIPNTDRTRDLTPTRAPLPRRDGTGEPADFPTAGGGERFLDFVQDELLPEIDARYRTLPYRVLAGHSFGGLLAAHAFFTRPGLCGAAIAASPTLRWDDELVRREAAAYLAAGPGRPRSFFFAMADEEAGLPRPNRSDRLAALLADADPAALDWRFLPLPDEDHGSVVLRAYYWGLRHAFADWLPPRDPATGLVTGSLAGLRAHYDRLGRRVGQALEPPEAAVNQAGYAALRRGDLETALELLRHNAARHPDSANVHDSLGEALEQAGDLEAAVASYARAVAVAERAGAANLEVFRRNRDRAAAALAAGVAGE